MCGMVWCRIACGMARRVRYRRSPDRIPYGSSRAVSLGSGPGVGDGRRVRYRSVPGTASRRNVACPIARCRIVCGMARRRITSRRVPARVGTLDVPAVVTVRRAARPSSAMPRPNSACSRRRPQRFTNIYSFAWPSRFSMARSAARLRRTVGPLSRHGSCRTGEPHGTSAIHGAEESGQPDITGHNRT